MRKERPHDFIDFLSSRVSEGPQDPEEAVARDLLVQRLEEDGLGWCRVGSVGPPVPWRRPDLDCRLEGGEGERIGLDQINLILKFTFIRCREGETEASRPPSHTGGDSRRRSHGTHGSRIGETFLVFIICVDLFFCV